MVFLVGTGDEAVARNPPGGTVRQIDHVVGGVARAVVETVVEDLDPGRANLDIMPAGTALEARPRDLHHAEATDIDRMSAVPGRVLAQPGKGRMIDRDGAAGVVGGQDAALIIDEHGVGDDKVAFLDPDARAVAVIDQDVGEDDAVDTGRRATQHQRRLALAYAAVEHDAAGYLGDERHPARVLHRALVVTARRDGDRAVSALQRRQRLVEAAEGLA